MNQQHIYKNVGTKHQCISMPEFWWEAGSDIKTEECSTHDFGVHLPKLKRLLSYRQSRTGESFDMQGVTGLQHSEAMSL
jgi:hypothetical protein